MDTVRVLSSCGTAAFGGTSVDVADLLDISLILEAPDDEHQTQEPLSAVLPPPLRSISPDVDKEIPSSKTWMDSDSTGSTKSRNGLLHNSKQWDSSSQSVAAPAAEGPQLTSSHQAVASFARSLIDSSAPDEEPDHYSDRAFNMEQILDPDHSSALRASLLSLVSDMLHNQPTNITPSTSQSPKELTQSAPTPDPIVVSQGDVLQIAIPDGHLVGRAKPVTQPSKTSEKAGKMDIIMNGGLSSSSTSSNLAVTRQKSAADYPDNIDHIEFDTVSNGSLPSARSNTEFASRQSRLFTIRNMNPSSKQAFSAMMSKLGEKHNMQYNEEKLCWESQDPDPPLALLDSELEGHMEHKPQIDHSSHQPAPSVWRRPDSSTHIKVTYLVSPVSKKLMPLWKSLRGLICPKSPKEMQEAKVAPHLPT
ncbi:hypothetical protein DFJ73DRAFT_137970 [Zopfochytrium polystomum]|nr:hypothetical protein DFJ73DRAFT_137970 [Zopfochytrium polystomum]